MLSGTSQLMLNIISHEVATKARSSSQTNGHSFSSYYLIPNSVCRFSMGRICSFRLEAKKSMLYCCQHIDQAYINTDLIFDSLLFAADQTLFTAMCNNDRALPSSYCSWWNEVQSVVWLAGSRPWAKTSRTGL